MFKTVLFDIDGVMLSEERYFDVSALTVHELLTAQAYLGVPESNRDFSIVPSESHIRDIRRDVFDNDDILEHMKNLGVNANWDMVYLVFVAHLASLLKAFEPNATLQNAIAEALANGWTREALGQLGKALHNGPAQSIDWKAFWRVYEGAQSRDDLFTLARNHLPEAARSSSDDHVLWCICRDIFQEWYLGDTYTGQSTGKAGFLTSEQPIVHPEALQELFAHLQGLGVRLGIGTGRPQIETEVPLNHFNLWKYFNKAHVSTASNVLEAEERVPSARPLSKPSPYSYLRSLMGSDNPEELLAMSLPLPGIRHSVLVVGDSIADALAAERLGASFAAVLTGLEGESARPKFEKLNADYIFSNVLDVKKLFS